MNQYLEELFKKKKIPHGTIKETSKTEYITKPIRRTIRHGTIKWNTQNEKYITKPIRTFQKEKIPHGTIKGNTKNGIYN